MARNAQLATKIVYWIDRNNQIYMGLPEQFPAPFGMEKIVCASAMQAEYWSQKMRNQEQVREEAKDEERDKIEGPIRDNLRKHMQHLAANARNNMNRDFILKHLYNYDKRGDSTKTKKVSYLHSEAYEHHR
jgi:hypothetical protein